MRGNGCPRVDGVIATQDFLLDKGQVILQRKTAIGVKERIAGVVVALVELPEGLQGQFRYGPGVPTRVMAIGGIRVEGVQQRTGQNLVGGGHGAFHFVEDDAFINEAFASLVIGLVFEAMTFLAEAGRFQAGEEDGVQVDVQ